MQGKTCAIFDGVASCSWEPHDFPGQDGPDHWFPYPRPDFGEIKELA